MSDRTMCADTACPRASQCRRSEQSGTEPDSRWQSWLLVSPRTTDGCLLFWATPADAAREVAGKAMRQLSERVVEAATARYPMAEDGVWWTLQGEGALIGTPMVFIRLAGCSVGCAECDTDYRVYRRAFISQILDEVAAVIPATFKARAWVWITGGEPTDHDIRPLIRALRDSGYRVALATSGVRRLPEPVDWLSVSPHVLGATVQMCGTELKLVIGLHGLTINDARAVASEAGNSRSDQWSFAHHFVQPLHADADSLRACIAFALATPGWRLSPQAHKAWQVR